MHRRHQAEIGGPVGVIRKEYGGLGLPLDVMELAIIADEFSSAGLSPGIYRHSIGVIRRCVSSQSLIGSIA